MSQFYALMHDYTVKYIPLKEDITTEIKNIFIKGGAILKPEGIEAVSYTHLTLPTTSRV